MSRLAYRKGIDLLVATAPHVCRLFPNVRFLVGGTGPKLIDLLQMREKHRLQDRIELLGPVAHGDVLSHLRRGHIFLNTSLTESFGIAILEAACAGLYVVSTRVGGVPEILPEDMICFAEPEEDDVVRAIVRAVRHVQAGAHDPLRAHARVRTFYDWAAVTGRTERVYRAVMATPERDLMERMRRNLSLGPWFGMIQVIILVVDCLFFLILEWLIPREDIDYVTCSWDAGKAREALREAENHEAQDGEGGEALGEGDEGEATVEINEAKVGDDHQIERRKDHVNDAQEATAEVTIAAQNMIP